MRKTILKIGKLHIWVSGSLSQPFSNIYFETPSLKGKKYLGSDGVSELTHCGYKGLNIFPLLDSGKVHTYKSCENKNGFMLKYGGKAISYQTKVRYEEKGLNKGLVYNYYTIGITNTLPKFLQRIFQEIENYKYRDFGNTIEDEKGNVIGVNHTSFLQYCIGKLKFYWFQKPCRDNGHDWDVESDITPDSGSEYFTCRRCGESHSVIYY